MKMSKQKSKELVNLSLVVVTIIIFTLFSFSINFIDIVHEYFPLYNTWPINSFYMNLIFLWLMVTLGITYKQWRKALRKQDDLEDIISSINRDVLIVVDANRNIIKCTSSLTRMFNYEVSEVLGRKIDVLYSLIPPLAEEKDEIEENGAGKGFHLQAAMGNKKDGTVLNLEVVSYHWKNNNGYVLLVRDVTERARANEELLEYRNNLENVIKKRTHELTTANNHLQQQINERKKIVNELRNTKNNLDKLIESSLDCILVSDSGGYVTRVNKYLLNLLGYTEDEVLGRHAMEFGITEEGTYESTTGECVSIDEGYLKDAKKNIYQRLFNEGKISNWESYYMTKNGKVIPVEQNITYLYNDDQEVVGSVGISRDITERRKTERKLKESRDFLEHIFKTSADGIMVTEKTCITMVNEAVEKILGYSRDEIIGKSTVELSPQENESYNRGKEFIEKLFEKGVVVGEERTWLRKDGSPVEVEMNAALLQDGTDIKSVAGIRDITARKRAENELRETKEYLDNVIESSLDPIITTDSKGYVSRANKAFLHLLGYTNDEVIGKHMAEFSPLEEGTYDLITGEVVTIGTDHFDKVSELMIGLVEEGKISNLEFHLIRKDKKVIPVEENIVYLYDKEGTVIGAVGIIRDISERIKSERDVKEAKEFLEKIIESSKDGILITDENGIIVSASTSIEGVCKFTKEELIGKHASTLTTDDKEMRGKILDKTAELFDRGYATYETKHKSKNDILVEVECTSTLIKDQKGNYVAGVSILRDITERKELENKMLQSEKLKSLGELAGGVAHDFNNVLAAILGRVQLLKMQFTPPPGIQEKRKSMLDLIKSLDIIERASFDGAETVRRIQEFSRRRTDDKDFTRVAINELLENVLDFTSVRWKDEAESKGIQVTIQKEFSSLPVTLGSASELREVFTNLINNALDAMMEGGSITIKTCTENKHIIIKFEDTGIGIPKDKKNRIFDPFFTTKGVQSTGLGMSISYGIINRHQGTIVVDSVEGAGTTFTIKLPILTGTGEKKDTGVALTRRKEKARVLIVDDEDEVRQLLSDILTSEDHDVTVAGDGVQALELFKENDFDMVFTDLGMPGMSGWEVAKAIKGINQNVPVAIITGWSVDMQEREMKGRGVDLIAFKPFEVKRVLQLVEEGMELKERFKKAC
jgi:PAS domain S-box-containing protein